MLVRLLLMIGISLGLLATVHAASPQQTLHLRDAGSPALQTQLEERLKRLNLESAVRNRQLAVALVDVTDPAKPRLAHVNGHDMMYAASLPKIAILLAAFERIHEGKLALDAENRRLMTDMIRRSSNTAATEMIRRVGAKYINELLSSPKYRLYDADMNGGLWVGKEYGQGTAYQRDPLHNLSHGATAFQVARFYYMLETGRLVSPELSREMKGMLGDPGIRHKFVQGLLAGSPEAQVYRKSGTWREWHADSAIVEHAGRTYIAVALARNSNGGEWFTKLIVELDRLIMGQPVRRAGL
jgi:beta-lactamase class A